MKIDAAYMLEPHKVEIRQVEIGDPGPGEIQIEVKACGICAWDIYLFKGKDLLQPFPFPFGHEAAGIVLKTAPDVKDFKPGDKVFCIDGGPAMAQVINYKAEFVGHLSGNLEKPEDFADKIGEPAVCAVNGLSNIKVVPGANVVIIGVGYMGLLNVQAFSHSHIGSLTCFDLDSQKLALAKKHGANDCYLTNSEDGQRAIADIISNGGADIVVECSGSQPGLSLATKLATSGGTISNFAWHRAERVVDASPWHLKGISIINTAPACDRHFSDHVTPTARLMARGVFDQKDFVTHVMDYHDIQEMLTLAEAREDGYIKGVIIF